jgi:hypothetical protein
VASNLLDCTLFFPTFAPSDTEENDSHFPRRTLEPITSARVSSSWPTPVASAWGATGQRAKLRRLLAAGVITELELRRMSAGNAGRWIDPEFWECLMGFSMGWTEIAPSETPSSPKLRKSSDAD